MRRILLTGSTGFIGSNLKESLSGLYDVLSPSHEEVELLDESAVREYMKKNPVDVVIGAATIPFNRKKKETREYAIRNLRLFFNVANNADCYEKFIFLGSGAEYDTRREISDAKESDDARSIPEDEYGFSKYVISKYIRGNGKFLDLRLFGVFGRHEDYQVRLISNAICKALFGLTITVNQNRRFSYLYISDLCAIVRHFIEHWPGERVINVVPDQKHELVSLAKLVKQISGSDVDVAVKNQGMGKEYTGSNALLRRCINDLEFTPMEEAVKELYAWYGGKRADINRELLLTDIREPV